MEFVKALQIGRSNAEAGPKIASVASEGGQVRAWCGYVGRQETRSRAAQHFPVPLHISIRMRKSLADMGPGMHSRQILPPFGMANTHRMRFVDGQPGHVPPIQADSAAEKQQICTNHHMQHEQEMGARNRAQARTFLSAGETKKQASARLDTGREDIGVKRGSESGLTGRRCAGKELRRLDTSFNLTALDPFRRTAYRTWPLAVFPCPIPQFRPCQPRRTVKSLFVAELRLRSQFPGKAAGGPLFGYVLRDGGIVRGHTVPQNGYPGGQSPVGPNSLLV